MLTTWWRRWTPFHSDVNQRLKQAPSRLLHNHPMLLLAAVVISGGWLGQTIVSWLLANPASATSGTGPQFLGIAATTVLILSAGIWTWLLLRRPATFLFSRSSADSSATTIWTVPAVLLASALLGLYWGLVSLPAQKDDLSELVSRKSQPVALRAEILSAPIWKPNPNHRQGDPTSVPWRTQWNVRCEAISGANGWQAVRADSSLSVDGRVSRFLPGDVVEVYGSVRRIWPATNPGGFDFADHQSRHGRLTLLSADGEEQVLLQSTRWTRPLSRIRAMAVNGIDHLLHRWVCFEKAPLAAALVFGQRQQVNWEQQQELMATGTLHMLAISGMHVEIVALGFLLICWYFQVRDEKRLLIMVLVCLAYAGLADGKPPVMRAAILVIAREVAMFWGRQANLFNLLALAGLVLFLSRASNLQNVGVHLSFAAVVAIGVFVLKKPSDEPEPAKKKKAGDGDDSGDREEGDKEESLKRLLGESEGPAKRLLRLLWGKVWGTLRLSFWVWLITCPLIWYHFNVIAPISIPLNLLLALPLAASLFCGLVTGILGWFTPVGWAAGIGCGVMLSVITELVEWGVSWSWGHIWAPAPSLIWITGFYGFMGLWLLRFGKERRVHLAFALTAWIVFAIFPSLRGHRTSPSREEAELSVTFLDVGHGTSVVIDMPDGRVWVYDAGHLGSSDRSHQEIASALWEMGVSEIDKLIVSHADADHYNAVPGLVERFRIGCVASTERFWKSQDSVVREVIELLAQKGIRCETWNAGTKGIVTVAGKAAGNQTTPDVVWRVLHPDSSIRSESDNASSLCLQLSFAGKTVLLPGDLDGSGLYRLVELPQRPCDVLMAPHHGSLTRDPKPLLRWCRPELTVISGNHRAARQQVIDEYAPETENLAITFRDGAIRCRIQASAKEERPTETVLKIERWEKNRWSSLEAPSE